MLFALIVLVAVGIEVSATSPRRYQPSKCPSPAERDVIAPMQCGPNSHFERCSKVCPPQACSALIDPYWLCESNCCKAECRCNDGYYKDDRTGLCISRDECLAQCGPFERFVKDCPECQMTCANYKVTGPRSLCKPFTGCVCQEGRVRLNDNATGPCVPTKECPHRQCPLHEHWEDCPSVCAKESCISRNPDYKCLLPAIPLPCKPRCICDKGFLRNHLGHCIPENHCPIKRCPINEVWRCASMCARDSCKRLEPGFKCPLGVTSVCIPACACKDGYLRNDKGLCVPRELCPASLCCGLNEVAVDCKAYPPLTCESVYTLYKPIDTPPCVPGCDCRPGYLRNKRNICVPSEFCPTVPHGQCGPRQEYKECGSSCEPSCSDLDNPPQVCPAVCVKGCFCKDGYRKDEHGNCVTRSECPLPVCNKPNEVAKDCGSYCEMKTCEDYNRTDIGCPAVCVRGCFCRKGYVRNAYGVCIRPEKCPAKPVCLQENEEYQSCGSSCPDNCLNYMNPDRICTMNCVSGCNCKKGYVRNLQDNTCIKPEQCPTKKCVGPNEELNLCASYCPVTCANRFTQGDWSCITLCREACDCVSGTLRNDNGTCVPVDQCSPPVCRQNEKYMKCGTACPLTCDNYKTPPPCTRQCVEDCFCEYGYVRDRYNRCVKPENCEPICPAGEKFNECSAHCQDTCENYNVTNRICTYQCQSGCVCEQGTVRRKDGKCVAPNECSAPTCPADEVYDPCSAHCEPTCEHNEPNRPCTAICIPGCRCGDGLVRRSDGKCVKLDQCPPPCPPSEHYDECNSHCEETCELHGSNLTCLPYCNPGCRCNDGLVRRKDGQCVNLEHCSALQCSVDEEYDPCSAHCEPTCESYGKNTVCAAYCEPGCRCKKGLVRRKDKQCVKPDECQNKPQCGVNERWVNCVIGLCIPLSCDQLGFPIACPGILGPCEGGCVCAENYVRDGNNVCIPQQNCPSCGNDFNATVGCGVNCGRLCTNYQNPPNCAVPQYCNFNGCDCREGYVFDTVTERCVAPVDCPIPCNGDLYAEKVKCPNPCPPTCARPTTKVCAKFCLSEGCQCRLNFVLNANGKCVKPEDCPVDIGCNGDPNAHISSCVSLCQPTCGVGPVFCPAFCRLGCACNTGYMLSKPDGICIKPEECVNVTTTTTEASCDTSTAAPYETTRGADGDTTTASSTLILCPQNEIWIDCKAGYCKPQHCRDMNANLAYPTVAHPCPGGCICRDGLLRNEEGVCIPKEQCPISKPCSDPNAIRKKCASHESCRATCAVPNSRVCPKICIIDGCECKQGYVLSERGGKCVRIEDCPRGNVSCNGDPNAVIEAFPPPCPSTCDMPNGIPGCLKLGLDPGCSCKFGYILSAENGKCILPDQCKGGNPCGANETFSWCRVNCPYDYCPVDDRRAIIACDPPYPTCPGGCVCKLNYKRKSEKDNRCIISSTCPPVKCTRPNEVWDPCPSECRRESCADVNNQPTTCNTLVLNCQPQCICKKGYFRNDTDICIPAKDCPANNQPCDDPNAERLECAPAPSCRSTCATPNPSPCILSCAVNECVCKKGFVLSVKGGKCIPVDQCPKDAPCNGDTNAVIKANPIPCPSTCSSPNASPWCKRYAPPVGCECKPGYLQAEDGGKCIKPDECPGGNPCGANGTFVWCRVQCPNNYCPVNDNRGLIACDPPYPCPSGCICKLNYKRRSTSDDTCIMSSTCPPLNCTRPNEVWDPCPSSCRFDNCRNYKQIIMCKPTLLNCQPQCVCKKKHYKNDKDMCVPESECPINKPCEDPNAERLACAPAPSCRSTCTTPNPSPCIEICAINECVCKKGFVLSENGKCIAVDQCPKDAPCNGDSNAVIKVDPIPCPSTCSTPNASPWCKRYAPPIGCECKPGYLQAEDGGKCIKPDECPGGNPCGVNGTFVLCSANCPTDNCPVSDSRGVIACSISYPCPTGCACKLNYRRKSNTDNPCILASDCPPVNCTRPNEVWSPCPSACLRERCADVNNQPTTCNTLVLNCQPQCICKKGYFRDDNDICIAAKQCPPPVCPKGEVYSECGSSCPPSCENKGNTCLACTQQCVPGCYCAGKTIRAQDGTCVLPEKCPAPKCTGPNEEFDECPPTCPRTQNCSNLWSKIPCTPIDCCKPQCRCKSGFFRNDKNICVTSRECSNPTPECGPNEVSTDCYNDCQKTCKNRITGPEKLCSQECGRTGCICKPDFLRHDNGTCVPVDQCCPPDCPKGEVYSDCGSSCPPSCKNKGNTCLVCTAQCIPGCYCAGKTIRSEDGTCVSPENCPAPKCTGPNEIFDKCPPTCPRTEKCSNLWSKEPCTEIDCCEPQCRCKPGFYRNDNNICISAQECTNNNQSCEDPNAERLECAPHPSCRSTCAKPNPSPCILSCAINQCVCKKGFVLSENGKCVTVNQCPKDVPCNGDNNAVIKANPIPCPSTCSSPNANPWCERLSPPVGCECKPGYLLAQDGGKCIKPDECPGGNPCGVNATFVWCSVNCPTNNCPVSDTRAIVACSPPFPCPNGCACKLNYKRRSSTDNTCILATDCPPVKCTRPNEIWSPCPSACLSESCADVDNQPTACNTLVATQCQPRCICKKGHFRNDSDICVPARECPNKQQCSDPNAERVKCAPAAQCRPTCAERNPGPCIKICVVDDCVCKKGFILSEKNGTCIPEDQCPAQCSDPNAERVRCGLNPECRASCAKPNPGPCTSQICIDNACVCKNGFVLSEKGGKCVAPEECPIQKSCNGDTNAQIKVCPLPCPATCDAPNAIPCRKACVDIGCECKDGYILSEFNGKCILPEKCKGGNPCGRNETFVSCKVPCPSDYCPVGNSPNRVICETPNPCLPGCVCKINYRRRSKDDQRCTYASECPPQKCNKNEVWSGCPSECLQEDCSNMNDPPVVCRTLLLNCQPKCICKKGYYRDNNRNCVPAKQCPKPIQCKTNEVYRTCRIICPPQTCASIYTDYDCRNATQCEPGCDCLPEYLRNGTDKDPCIPSNLCPINGGPSTPECGINEHYETDGTKCDLTCKNYDLGAQIGPCEPRCGCFCDDGYVRNSNGVCIPKKKCPKNIVCKKNEVLSECYNSCHKTCKTRIRGDGRMCSLACTDTGCLCVEGYLRHDNGTCVPISECSPPQCHANETYSSCGSACPPTCQNRGDNCTACTDQCVEDCFCCEGYLRADDGTCVKPKDCPARTCNDPNEYFDECPPTCPPTDGCSNIWSKFNCTNAIQCCKPQCRCKSGYYRNNKGICIPIDQCIGSGN